MLVTFSFTGWLMRMIAKEREFAKSEGFCLVTQDVDFADRSYLYGSPPKVIWLRCGNTPTSKVEAILRSAAKGIQELIDSDVLDCLELDIELY